MKFNYNPRLIGASIALVTAFFTMANAGVVEGVFLSKSRDYNQSSASSVKLLTKNALPYSFSASVDGGDGIASLNPPPTIRLPKASGFSSPALGLGGEEEEGWNFGYVGKDVFDNWGTSTKAEIDRLFPSGTYVFSIEGKSVKLSLPKDTYPNAPVMVLSGGAWRKGAYRIPANKTLTINSGTFSSYGSHLNDYLGLVMEDSKGRIVFEHEQVAKKSVGGPRVSSSRFHSRRIPANKLKAGRSYFIFCDYSAIVSQSTAIPDAICIAYYGVSSRVKVVVDPAN